MLRKLYSALGATIFLAGLAASAADPIRIGLSAPITGGSAPMGVSSRDAIQLAAEEINAKGGILGRPIQLIERDDEGKNEIGIQVSKELIEKERVVATVGFVNTGVALAATRLYQDAEIPVFSCGTTGTMVTKQFLPPDYPHNYVFRNGLYDSLQAAKMVEEAVETRKFSRIAILADSSNYGQLGRADVEAALAKRGLTAVAVEKFNVGDVDMSSQLLRARQAGAEVILTYGIAPELAQIANGLAKLGWKVPLVGSNPMGMSSFADLAGPNAEGAHMVQAFIQETKDPRGQAFVQAYRARYHVSRIPNVPPAAQCYDSLYLLAAAITQAKSTAGNKILDALEHLQEPVAGAMMTYRAPFSPQQHDAFDPKNAVIGEVRGGNVVYAYEAERDR